MRIGGLRLFGHAQRWTTNALVRKCVPVSRGTKNGRGGLNIILLKEVKNGVPIKKIVETMTLGIIGFE